MREARVALVTGASRGIGRHLVEHFVGRGFVTVGCSRQPSEYVAEGYDHHVVDVTNEDAVVAMMRSIRKQHGGLDILINNAGIASMNHAMLTPAATVERLLSTNVTSTFTCSREAAKLMRKQQSGRIVNFTTVAVPLKIAGEAAYAASKAAVISLTQVLAREFAALGITVNAVGPGPIATDLIAAVPEAKLQKLIEQQAIQRFGTCADVANVVDFFIDPKSDFITGQTIYLGGVS